MLTVTAGPLWGDHRLHQGTSTIRSVYMDVRLQGPDQLHRPRRRRAAGGRPAQQSRTATASNRPMSSIRWDTRINKDVVEKLEDRLIEIARANLVPLANDPAVGGLGGEAGRSPEIEELLRDARREALDRGMPAVRAPACGRYAPTTIVCRGHRGGRTRSACGDGYDAAGAVALRQPASPGPAGSAPSWWSCPAPTSARSSARG